MEPPPGIDELIETHILQGAIRELAIPLILNLCDLPRRLVVENVDLAVDRLLFLNTLHDVAGPQVQSDWVASRRHFMMEALDL